MFKTTLLFIATAVAEILGCYLPYLWVKKEGGIILLIPAAASLIAFVSLLMLHPAASGRVYASYGGVYILTALLWLRFIDGVKLTSQDWVGSAVIFAGVMIMLSGWSRPA
ncbi:YnfA family protein [Acerihabitans arboris]|uniref:YnfA family protein n=1 Tax=Acerihabitans arboris TaxID=2691583 RepID=A0A845SKJ5_9GAMM|nr:YnfA family protein [Acerihabitans arboris]NDL63141.1 YnfA family protein [Acerihabitans arboris]